MIRWSGKLFLASLMLFTLVACVTDGQSSGDALTSGQKAFKSGDYKTAYQQLYPLANNGQPDAQYAVGYMTYYGKGTVKNEQVGEAWIREAAVNGQSQAEQALGLLTQKGMFDIKSSG